MDAPPAPPPPPVAPAPGLALGLDLAAREVERGGRGSDASSESSSTGSPMASAGVKTALTSAVAGVAGEQLQRRRVSEDPQLGQRIAGAREGQHRARGRRTERREGAAEFRGLFRVEVKRDPTPLLLHLLF